MPFSPDQSHYRALVDKAPIGIFEADENGQYTGVNPAGCEMVGYSKEELLEMSISDLEANADTLEEVSLFSDAQKGNHDRTETKLVHKNGDTIDVLLDGVQIDEKIVGYVQEITERKEFERELRELKGRYQTFVDYSTDIITVTDTEGTITFESSAVEGVLGYKPETRIGDNVSEYIHPEDRQKAKGRFRAVLNQEPKATERTEVRFEHENGSYRWLESVVIDQTESEIGGLVFYSRDITKRKEREEKYRNLFEDSRDALIVSDRDGHLDCNTRTLELFGFDSVNDFLDNPPTVISPPQQPDGRDSEAAAMEHIETAFKEGIDFFEWTHQRVDGTEFPAEVKLSRFSYSGETLLLALIRDISERKEREARLQQYRQAVENSPNMLTAVDEDLNVLFANQRFREEFQLESNAPNGSPITEVIEGNVAKRITSILNDALAGESVRVEEAQSEFAGSHQIFDLRSYPLRDDEEKLQGALVALQDVTESERVQRLEKRERILRGLHSTTEEFLAADSKSEVYESVVRGLSDFLEIQYPNVWRFDSEAGALMPTALSHSRSETMDMPSNVEPGDHPLWQAFSTGETRAIQDMGPDIFSNSDISQATQVLLVPIEDKGIIAVEDLSDQPFEEIEIEMVELLANNAEAMLERLQREAEIRELDHEITAMETQMRKMKSWMNAIETIQQQLSVNDTRETMERVVCEELLGVQGIDFVWIGRPETSVTDISPVEWAGTDNGYLDEVELEEGNEVVPSLRAANHRAKITISNVAGHVSEGEWAKVALSSNYRSLVSIPIENDDILYGVLTAYSSEKSAFGQLSQSLMADIGSILANTYRMLNIRTDNSDAEVEELEFNIQDDSYPLLALARRTETTVSFDAILETSDSTVRILLSVVDGEGERVLERAQSMLKIENSDWFGKPEDDQLVLTVEKPFIAEAVKDHGGRLVESVVDQDEATVRIHHAANLSVRQMIEWLSTQYEKTELLARRTRQQPERSEMTNTEEILTEKQYETLKAAYHGGYYETPKGITGKELAKSFDLSRPAIYNRLQAAQRRMLKHVFDADPNYRD